MIYRQGDVLIMAVGEIAARNSTSEVEREGGRVILARGEATGHHHAIADSGAVMYAGESTDDRFLRVLDEAGVSLTHEEHDTITLPPGDYRVRMQREYTPERIVPVVD